MCDGSRCRYYVVKFYEKLFLLIEKNDIANNVYLIGTKPGFSSAIPRIKKEKFAPKNWR
jgi:hypothetical protein